MSTQPDLLFTLPKLHEDLKAKRVDTLINSLFHFMACPHQHFPVICQRGLQIRCAFLQPQQSNYNVEGSMVFLMLRKKATDLPTLAANEL